MSDADRSSRPTPGPGASGINWLLVILLLLLTAYVFRGAVVPSRLHDPGATEKPIAARGDLAEDEKSTIEIFQRDSPSVVNITRLAVQRDLLSPEAYGVPQGTGSGIVWDQNGYIVTNYHVIESAQAAKVTLADRTEWDARLVGVAPDKDLAVVKIDAPAEKLRPIAIGTSANLQVGQKVFAIGNPFGLDQTLTTGLISQLDREIMSVTQRPIQGVIQTDAAINPGNSGGPLLDSAGLMIGMTTAIYSRSGVSTGIGFAVPVDTVNQIVPELIRDGRIKRVGMGVTIWDDRIASQLGMRGVLVRDVVEGSPAEEAGILPTRQTGEGHAIPGDLIVAVNGHAVRSRLDLYRVLDQFKAGDTVTLTVRRGETETNISVEMRVLK